MKKVHVDEIFEECRLTILKHAKFRCAYDKVTDKVGYDHDGFCGRCPIVDMEYVKSVCILERIWKSNS